MLFQIWRALPRLREEAHAATWLYRVALNTAISFLRKDKSRRNRLVSDTDQPIHDIPDPGSDRYSHTNERFSELSRAIMQLNATERAVITLFLEDLSYAQMAAVLGITENRVGVMLHRAKKKLAALMKESPCTTLP